MSYVLLRSYDEVLRDFGEMSNKLLYQIFVADYNLLIPRLKEVQESVIKPKTSIVLEMERIEKAINLFLMFVATVLGVEDCNFRSLGNFTRAQECLGLTKYGVPKKEDIFWWFRYHWPFLHLSSIIIQLSDDRERLLKYFEPLFYQWHIFLSCNICVINFQKKDRLGLIKRYFRRDIILGIYELHNSVQPSGGDGNNIKPKFPWESFLELYHLKQLNNVDTGIAND